MLLRALLVALLLLAAPAADAQRRLVDVEAQKDWLAVGRLNFAGYDRTSMCSATLVAPDLVLTAAHCLFHPRTGKPRRPGSLRFAAGYRGGRAAAVRAVGAVHLPVDYSPGNETTAGRVSGDLALLRLSRPIREIAPIAVDLDGAGALGAGDALDVFSYGHDRAHALSRERACRVIQRYGGAVATTCFALPGISGAPLVIPGPDGAREGARVVGVVSAMTTTVAHGPGAQRLRMQGGAALGAASAEALAEIAAAAGLTLDAR